jgi:hypothetical protein
MMPASEILLEWDAVLRRSAEDAEKAQAGSPDAGHPVAGATPGRWC